MLRTSTFVLVLALAISAPSAQRPTKRSVPARLAPGPTAVSQDVGDIAVVVDNGLLITRQNRFDLNGVTLRFTPVGEGTYAITRGAAQLDPQVGPALTFGHPGATLFPGDDDSEEMAFPAGFPFFGTTYTTLFVNTDGNVTFGEPDFASSDRDKARHVLGPPRVSAALHDWNAYNALNTAGSGTIHAVVKADPDRLVATWQDVADFEGGVSNTFQLTLFATGAIAITFTDIETASTNAVVGVAEGRGRDGLSLVDYTMLTSGHTVAGGAILEAFALMTNTAIQEVVREFYKTHPDEFDFVSIHTDFPDARIMTSPPVKNQTHGIGTLLDPGNGEPQFPDTVFDFSAEFGSAGELEQVVFMNNIYLLPSNPELVVNPHLAPYEPSINVILNTANFGWPVALDGQPMHQVRMDGTLPLDNGEFSQYFARGGSYSLRLMSLMNIMAHEVGHRWIATVRFVHPTKGTGFDSYDLLGRDIHHWSFFVDTGLPAGQFDGAPRSSVMEGNTIVDLGPLTSYGGTPITLAPGERVFITQTTELTDGFSALDQHLMGLRLASEVGPFFYVDEPTSIYTGQSLDAFDPNNPLNTAVTMRGWQPMGGIVFKGKRVDLTLADIQAFEKTRERSANPRGRRFWGPRTNLTVRYFSDTGRVDAGGDASIVLSAEDRELGDEADMIDGAGRPVDVKTMAFVLVVQDGPPLGHGTAITRLDELRRAWQAYGNGPATGGRGRFDTVLQPAIH